MRIGEAARVLGVATHVLRHWEDEGVVVPDRTAAGHRDYTAEHVRRLEIVRVCQGAGLSLAEVRLVLHRGEEGRSAVIASRLAVIRRQRAELADAEAFLDHVRTCRHTWVTRCPACSDFGVARGARDQ